MPKNNRGGPVGNGSGRIPKTDCPLDPEPGLGGIFSVGLFCGKASLIWERIPDS